MEKMDHPDIILSFCFPGQIEKVESSVLRRLTFCKYGTPENLRNEGKRNLLKFKNKLNNMSQKPRAEDKINQERERFMNRLQQLRNDIVLWENNIGFFASTKNAKSMIEEVQNKINKAKETINLLEQKIEMIDNMDANNKEA